MHFFYHFLISYFFLISFYYYSKNFKNSQEFTSYIFKKILISYFGYKISPFQLNELPSKLIIIGSHTSIFDFIIGSFFYYAFLHERYDTYVLMKKEFEIVCKPLLYFFDRKFKLISVSKNKNANITTDISNKLENKNNYIIFIAPEGTRSCTEKIKSGYWYIAKNLNAHIAYLAIDFSSKDIILENPRAPMETFEEDQKDFINSCKKYVPMYPERCFWTRDFYNT